MDKHIPASHIGKSCCCDCCDDKSCVLTKSDDGRIMSTRMNTHSQKSCFYLPFLVRDYITVCLMVEVLRIHNFGCAGRSQVLSCTWYLILYLCSCTGNPVELLAYSEFNLGLRRCWRSDISHLAFFAKAEVHISIGYQLCPSFRSKNKLQDAEQDETRLLSMKNREAVGNRL